MCLVWGSNLGGCGEEGWMKQKERILSLGDIEVCSLLVVSLWTNHWTSLCFGFPICKMSLTTKLAYYFKITLLFEATQYTKKGLSFLHISIGPSDRLHVSDLTNACRVFPTNSSGSCFCLSKRSPWSVIPEYLLLSLSFPCMILLLFLAQVALLSGYLKFSFDVPAVKQLNYK